MLGIFLMASLGDLAMIYSDQPYRVYTKPIIMLGLIGYFLAHWKELEEGTLKKTFLIGICAAWLGDVLLLFDNLFVIGLICFLIMQGRYFACFIRDGRTNKIALAVGVVLIPVAALITNLMWTDIADMRIPVVIYMIALIVTALAAAARKQSVKGYYFVMVGTLLFVLSDTVLALHQFTSDIRLGSLTVMATYIMAQFLIVEGYLQGRRKLTSS